MAEARMKKFKGVRLVPAHYEDVETETVEVSLSREEALALVALSGYVGGDPEGPRGDFASVAQEVSKALGLHALWGDAGDFDGAAEALGVEVNGSARFEALA